MVLASDVVFRSIRYAGIQDFRNWAQVSLSRLPPRPPTASPTPGAKVDDDHPPVEFDAQYDVFLRMIGPTMSPVASDDEVADAMSGSRRAWLAQRADASGRSRSRFDARDLLLLPVLTVAASARHAGELIDRTIEVDGGAQPLVTIIVDGRAGRRGRPAPRR